MGIEIELIRLGRFARLAGMDLDASWRDASYCVIDVETTGLDLKSDEIIAIGTTQIKGARIQMETNFYREVRPQRRPSIESVEIHGLRSVDLESASPIESMIPDLVKQLQGRVLIAHAKWIEKAFLERHLAGSGRNFFRGAVDTAALARAIGYASEGNDREPSLESLARRLRLPVYAPHNALGDALTTAVLFLAEATELERVKIAEGASLLSLKELLKISEKNSRE